MKEHSSGFFWPSYTDLMTSLFFIMLVLYVLTYTQLRATIKLQEEKLAIINAVEQTLKPLKEDSKLFEYEKPFKRFKLAFEVRYETNKYAIVPNEIINYDTTVSKIREAGAKLQEVVNRLAQEKAKNPLLKNVSYILVIAGYASKNGNDEKYNYELSYRRAWSLWNFWKENGINFESDTYNDLIDLQITGNGWGGVGRTVEEIKNQRFLIQIFPKIGDINESVAQQP